MGRLPLATDRTTATTASVSGLRRVVARVTGFVAIVTVVACAPLHAARTTFFNGASQGDEAFAVTTDANGNIYIAGATQSADLPGVTGSAQPTLGGRRDGFIAKFNPTLTTLIAATYVGGGGDDVINGIAVAANGDVVAVGQTRSDDFPGFAAPAAGGTGFIVRYNGGLTTRVSSLRVGPSTTGGSTALQALALAADGSVVAAGGSTDPTLGQGALVVRSNAAGSSIVNAVTLGMTGDRANAVLVTPGGDIIVAGRTAAATLPASAGTVQAAPGGARDGFVVRFSAALAVIASTYVGGSADDSVTALTLASGKLWVGGTTSSPTIPGLPTWPAQVAGASHGFVFAMDPSLAGVATAVTAIAGSGEDQVLSLATAPDGTVLAAGSTTSTDLGSALGTSGSLQPAANVVPEGFVARLNVPNPAPAGSAPASYLGGPLPDAVRSIAVVGATGNLALAGGTLSTALPFTAGAAQTSPVGAMAAFATVFPTDLSSRADTTTTLSVSPATVVYGQPLQWLASVTSTTTTPAITGSVNFTVDGTSTTPPLAAVLVATSSGFSATFPVTTLLAVGTHSVVADYLGDGNFRPSTSATQSFAVNQAPTTTTFTLEPSPPIIGRAGTVHATVRAVAPSVAVPAGLVSLWVDGAQSGAAVTLSATGVADLPLAAMSAGAHTVEVRFAGNANFVASSAGPLSVTPITAAWLSFSPSVLDFGDIPVGAPNVARSITVTNAGNAPWTAGALMLATPFFVSSTCGATLAPGASCVLTINYTPSQVGSFSAQLSLAGNQLAAPSLIAITAQSSSVLPIPAMSGALLGVLGFLLALSASLHHSRWRRERGYAPSV